MVNIVVKPNNTEISLSTANTVYGARAVRLVNTTAGAVLITITAGANTGTANGTFTLRSNSEVIVPKTPTDTITANAAILATPVAFM